MPEMWTIESNADTFTCLRIQAFWLHVNHYVNWITKARLKIPLCPLLHIFGIAPTPQGQPATDQLFVNSWAYTCFLIAKRCIMRNWVEAQVPTMDMFFNDLSKPFRIERIDMELNPTQPRRTYLKRWHNYIKETFDRRTAETLLNPDGCT